MTEFNGVNADGALYHTTTSVAARLGVSYEDAKALIASGRIPSVSAESVGVNVNKPGARLVSESALSAYQRSAAPNAPSPAGVQSFDLGSGWGDFGGFGGFGF